jgi:hypothetical protein
MSLAYIDRSNGLGGAHQRAGRFWQFIERALNAYSLERTKRVVAEKTFRRCSVEVARYRRLLHKQDSVQHVTLRGKSAPCKVAARRGR